MLFSLFVSVGLSTLRAAVTDPSLKAKIRDKVLEVYRAIQVVYGDDPDFQP